ncbi:30S ribosomal protein S9 [bacterium]|jgi:small subunit ribosomal protein S9|nr:30S ribosomal protein S9 [bacterium]
MAEQVETGQEETTTSGTKKTPQPGKTSKRGIHAVGRRKRSVARAYLRSGTGNITVNSKPMDQYFARKTLQMVVNQPFEVLENRENYDVLVTVSGGGTSGQAGAVRHAISRALTAENTEEFRSPLKGRGFLTRDARAVERKKYGRHKARKKPQFSKR